jgi:DNA-binding SARP family transcriptional activator
MLLLEADRLVSTGTLIDELWGQQPPASATTQVHNSVSAIRRRLSGAGGSDSLITTTRPGVRLAGATVEIDLQLVDRLVASARLASDPVTAAQCLRDALALWTGPSLAGLKGSRLEAAAAHLDERRLAIVEDLAECELKFGDPARLVAELASQVAAHPLRERLVGDLMLALYRSGRQAEALDVFRRLRRRLRDELGIQPGPPLADLQRAILRTDPRLDCGSAGDRGAHRVATPAARPPASPAPAPAQLPPARPTFSGRTDELAGLNAWAAERTAGTTGVCLVVGGPGVGKTSLVTQWAHTNIHRYPDGQLWVSLRGDRDTPGEPINALSGLLRTLGVQPAEIPTNVEEASALYRTLLADRRVLVVLDDADSGTQVRPLLPGGPGCAVLITSRDRLTEMVTALGARRITLGGLTPADAVGLLERTVRDDRLTKNPSGAQRLAEACGFLPLALCVAASNLVDDPYLSVADQVIAVRRGALVRPGRGGEPSPVRLAVDRAYAGLTVEERRAFRLLGRAPGADITLAAVATLVGLNTVDTRRLIDRLCAVHFVEQHRPGRYLMPAQLRHYARLLGTGEGATAQ